MFRKGVIKLLSGIPSINSIKEAENGLQALEKCRLHKIDFIFLDISMPIMNGEAAAKIIKKELPQIKIIVITMLDSKHQIIELLRLGVNGFILKSTDENELLKAINLILDGNQYLTPEVKEKWIDYLLNQSAIDTKVVKPKLSNREIEIMRLLADQLTTKEIANKICLAESTINSHKKHIMKKIKTETSLGIVMYAIRNGIYIP
jgi:two-component system response regulator NreC